MFKILVPAVVALGLVAFTAKTQDVSAEPATPAQSGPTMAWHLSTDGDMAKLAYGVANSDQLAMMVTCAPGDRTAVVYGDIHPLSPNLATSAEDGAGEDSAMSEMQLPLRDPALRGLADQGRMRVRGQAGVFGLTATTQERRAIGQFLGYCGSSRA